MEAEFLKSLLVPLAIGTVMQQIIGGLYYGPFFGDLFVKLAWKNKKPTASMGLALGSAFVGALLMNAAVLLACVITNVLTPVDGKLIFSQWLI